MQLIFVIVVAIALLLVKRTGGAFTEDNEYIDEDNDETISKVTIYEALN